jgi:hypothetical protein
MSWNSNGWENFDRTRMMPRNATLDPTTLAGWGGRLVVDRTISDEWPLVPGTRLTAKEVAAWFKPPHEWPMSTIARHYGPPVTVEDVEACVSCVNSMGPTGFKY